MKEHTETFYTQKRSKRVKERKKEFCVCTVHTQKDEEDSIQLETKTKGEKKGFLMLRISLILKTFFLFLIC